ncbi:L-seryl-tRNA(Sec) selenium transferase [Allonocardiopsis opalescens]|uniref:L-seryl-tRNA(Sec) selenium transferase n=1 Tax=Allonocardiopsis opalescens TaxID=1144618 RepID=A0A2T0QCG8_9ACTN|nr:L-seryl-tRNA(Sec) selenium transferase [Allonocardiopsis opalescens]PRY01646.1 L-seryl-tRNA(Sec) selenium transferase [Allonocardiopsis opalescens]
MASTDAMSEPMSDADSDPRRRIPRTDALLADPRFAAALPALGRPVVKAAIAAAQDRARAGALPPERVAEAALAALPGSAARLSEVVNASGVIVHTNLGRAALSEAARTALLTAAGSTDVEFDLATGARARRGRGALAALAERVPEAGGVHVVNNNAAALLLCALVLAPGREIVISRGELVEIGDGFRIPELLAATGARLREVGTTNRTHLDDYRAALGPDTGFILKVHPSNFEVTGFTSGVGTAELATLGPPVVHDVGSGLLRPHPLLPGEPDAATALREGAALVTASGDKLLGGPQAGLLLGEAELVERLRRHPVARALRVDKLTLAALEATVRGPVPPVVAALERGEAELVERARALAAGLAADGIPAEAVPSRAVVGGGGAPGVELPSAAVALPERFAAALRTGRPPVVGRIEAGRCLLDLRTVEAAQDARLAAAVRAAAAGAPAEGDAPCT